MITQKMIKYGNNIYKTIGDLKSSISKQEYNEAVKNKVIDFAYREEEKEYNDIKLYYFYNPINKHTITSCLSDLEHLRNVKGYNVDEWILLDKG